VRGFDPIYHEDLQTAKMVRNRHLAKSICDASWSVLLAILTLKAAYAGKRVIAVPPAYTSQRCSGCAVLVANGLSVRWRSRPECGSGLDVTTTRRRTENGLGRPFREAWPGRVGEPRIPWL
jgi:putative transposase